MRQMQPKLRRLIYEMGHLILDIDDCRERDRHEDADLSAIRRALVEARKIIVPIVMKRENA